MTTVRALFTAAACPTATAPFDTLAIKIAYPAAPTGSDVERLSGVVPVDAAAGQLPLVVIANGINVSPEAYTWLATRIASAGFAVATYTWVGELFAGQYGLTPGVDLTAVTPDAFGSKPSWNGLQVVLDAIAALPETQPLHGKVDLDRIAVVGHSAGGTMCFQSARTSWFPGLRAAVTFAAHNGGATALGWPEGTILDVEPDVPFLVMGGAHDGVIQRSADRYGPEGHARDPITRTFHEHMSRDQGDTHLAILRDANHFSVGWPEDPTVARGFLDGAATNDEENRALIGDLISAFLRREVRGEIDAAADVTRLLASERIATTATR